MARLNHVKSFRGTSKTADGNLTCGKCGDKITKGDSYRWWSNRSPGMRGGVEHYRCAKPECTPSQADMTPGKRGQLYAIQEAAERNVADWEGDTTDDLEGVWEEAADDLRALAEEIRESAENMEEGFGHSTYQSEELAQKAEDLEYVCDDEPDFEDPPEREDFDEGDDGDDEYAEAMESWREEQRSKVTEKLYEAEV